VAVGALHDAGHGYGSGFLLVAGISLAYVFYVAKRGLADSFAKAMNGFYTADGLNALGYYDGSDIPYYYALADNFTLCGNYFCYQLGPTLPNRIALWTGTSGGITTAGYLLPFAARICGAAMVSLPKRL